MRKTIVSMSLMPIVSALAIACGVDRNKHEILKFERDRLYSNVQTLQSEASTYLKMLSELEEDAKRLRVQFAKEKKEMASQITEGKKKLQELTSEISEITEERTALSAELKGLKETINDTQYRRFFSSFSKEVQKRNWEAARVVFMDLAEKFPDSPFKDETRRILVTLTELRESVLHLQEFSLVLEPRNVIAHGLVRNISSEPLAGIQALVVLRKDNDNFLGSAVSPIDVDPLMINQGSPFSVEVETSLFPGIFSGIKKEIEFQQKDGTTLRASRGNDED